MTTSKHIQYHYITKEHFIVWWCTRETNKELFNGPLRNVAHVEEILQANLIAYSVYKQDTYEAIKSWPVDVKVGRNNTLTQIGD